MLGSIDLDASADAIREAASIQGRLVAATDEEMRAAEAAVGIVLAHPILRRAAASAVAVGARVTPRPPHGSVRAPLCIRLLPRVPDGETLVGPGVKDSRLWEPVVGQLRHSSPGETAFLTGAASY